jgi:hypothetical protein
MVKEVLGFEEQLKTYLSTVIENPRVVSDCLSRCKSVQRHEGDLAQHFKYDKGKSLLDKMTYTLEEANQKISPKHSIKFKGSKGYRTIYEGTYSLHTAIKHYFKFMEKVRNEC